MIAKYARLNFLLMTLFISACGSSSLSEFDDLLSSNSSSENTATDTDPISIVEPAPEPGIAEPGITEPGVTETGITEPESAESPVASENTPIYFNDFATVEAGDRIDQFVAYRDPFVVNHVSGSSDHSATGGINCSAPEATRSQSRNDPSSHVYQCLPGGNADAGHQMAYAMDSSGYGFTGALPDQVFEGLREVSVDINTTTAGSRNFIEIKIIPAGNVYVNAMPCIPDLPCNDGWDYDDINAVGAGTNSQEGTGLTIATPQQPDGYQFDHYNSERLNNGDNQYAGCSDSGFCFHVATHENNTGIRERFTHTFRDNGDGTLSFGIEQSDGTFSWVQAPGSFPNGPVRAVVAFHNYTGTKDGNGPGFADNLSPSTGGFTWHWDNLTVYADTATPSIKFFDGHSADRIVTPKDCIAFAQGQRTLLSNTDILPRFHCAGDPELE